MKRKVFILCLLFVMSVIFGGCSIPNLILYKDGAIINRQVGALPKNELKALIENSLN